MSIHANSAPDNTTAKGTETFVRTGEPDSERLGAALQRSLTSALGTIDRGVRPNRYLVVRRAQMPAALVEVAFLADPEEEALLMEEWFRERAAQGIFNGLLRYFYPQDELESDWAGASTERFPGTGCLRRATWIEPATPSRRDGRREEDEDDEIDEGMAVGDGRRPFDWTLGIGVVGTKA